MPIIDSIGQLIEGVSFVFGRLCSCHSVIALGGQFSWNWSKVAVNRDLLNVERAVWFMVFWTCHRPHHVSGVRGPGNGSLFFRWIAYVIYSGSCLIPLRRSPSATAMKISVDDIAFSVYDGVYIRDGMSSIGDSWTDEVTKNIFLNNNTFHLIIMMISVVLCKINEEINYVSIFHNHVVRIWLHNRPAKLSWNRNKNSKLQMLCLEYIVWWYGQFVTNWYHFIEMSFHST